MAEEREQSGWLARLAAIVAFGQINILLTLIAAFVLGAAAVFLTTAWLIGPKIQLERAAYARFTGSSDARIVDSWVALELDQSQIRSSRFWRASAKASACVVVELKAPAGEAAADWGGPERRAFCGPRLAFNETYTLADLREIAPGVPFAWPKDPRGFAIPEIRMAPATWQWLNAHPAHTFMHSDWPATNELEWLRLQFDRPVDQAIAGWSAPPAMLPLQFDPAHAERPLPDGTVSRRRAASPRWFTFVVVGALGLWLWVLGFRLVPQLAGLAPQWRWFVMILPLLTLPTWVDTFPQFLRPMSALWSTVIGDMLGDLDPLDRLEATEPSRALLIDGVRMRWMASAGAYRDTFGRFSPTTPPQNTPDPDRALLTLSNTIAERVRSAPPDQRAALFAQLRSDKRRDLKAAGIVFLAAARECREQSNGADGRAAAAFLDEWFVQPVETPDSHDLAFKAREQLMAAH